MTFLQTSTTRKSLIPAYLSPGNGGGTPIARRNLERAIANLFAVISIIMNFVGGRRAV